MYSVYIGPLPLGLLLTTKELADYFQRNPSHLGYWSVSHIDTHCIQRPISIAVILELRFPCQEAVGRWETG